MTKITTTPLLLIAIWPALLWYCQRCFDHSDEPLGLLALATLVLLLERRLPAGFSKKITKDTKINFSDTENSSLVGVNKSPAFSYILVSLGLIAFCVSECMMPKLVQAIFAVTTCALYFSFVKERRLLAGDWLLVLLTVPVIASLNFYFGYPLRLLVTGLSSALLNFNGFATTVDGSVLNWHNQALEIDAPCSGVKMLWCSTYMAAALSSAFQFTLPRTIRLVALSMVLALVANVLRVTALFFIESQTIQLSLPFLQKESIHPAIGVIVFSLAAAGLLYLSTRPEQGLVEKKKTKPARLPARPLLLPSIVNAKVCRAALMTLCLFSACLPLFAHTTEPVVNSSVEFPGWPGRFEERSLRVLPDPKTLSSLAEGFPGKIGLFSDGHRTICIRWIDHETRQLHSAADCYAAQGYEIHWRGSTIDGAGLKWSRFEADKADEHLSVRELIRDDVGHQWNDVSAWYWSALLQHTHAPWWAYTVTERIR